jgi:hypothetical protein
VDLTVDNFCNDKMQNRHEMKLDHPGKKLAEIASSEDTRLPPSNTVAPSASKEGQ